MARARSKADLIVEYFETAPEEAARVTFDIVQGVMRRRTAGAGPGQAVAKRRGRPPKEREVEPAEVG